MVHFSIPKRIDPFPQRYRTVLTTAFSGAVPTSVSSLQAIARLNSIYLPVTGGNWPGSVPAISTLKPTGFDRLMSIYAYRLFRVVASRIVVEVTPIADVDTVLVTITPSTSSSNPPGASEAMSTELTRFKQISRGQPASSNRVTNKISVSTLMGVRPQAIEDDMSGSFTGTYNANPGVALYWTVWIKNISGANFNTAVTYTVRLEHDVICWADTQATDPPLFEGMRMRSESVAADSTIQIAKQELPVQAVEHTTSSPVRGYQDMEDMLNPHAVRNDLGNARTPTSALLLKAYERALAKEAARAADDKTGW